MDKYIEYAPIIIVIVGFLISYGIFVTPKQMDVAIGEVKDDYKRRFDEIKKDYVQKEVHDLAINEMKEDISEIKDKLNIIYDKIIKM